METQSQHAPEAMAVQGLGSFFSKIYSWMFFGIGLSALTAYVTISSGFIYTLLQSPVLFYGFAAIELAIVLVVQFAINKLPVELSRGLFFAYAGLNGVTLSWIFAVYSNASIIGILLIAAGLFGALAIYGYTTKKDLSGWGTFLFIGVIGVFSSSILNIFLQNSFLDMIVSGAALLVFAGLTVYDNQIYKDVYAANMNDSDALKKQSTVGALHMYINFIMIFVNLLKFFGGSRD